MVDGDAEWTYLEWGVHCMVERDAEWTYLEWGVHCVVEGDAEGHTERSRQLHGVRGQGQIVHLCHVIAGAAV